MSDIAKTKIALRKGRDRKLKIFCSIFKYFKSEMLQFRLKTGHIKTCK